MYVRVMIEAFLQSLQFEKRGSAHTITSYKTDLDHFSKNIFFQYEIT